MLPGRSMASHTKRIRECFLNGILPMISFGTDAGISFLSTFPLYRNYS